MKKYWKYKEAIVAFEGTEKEFDEFIKVQSHLGGNEIDEPTYLTLKKDQDTEEVKRERKREFPEEGDALDEIFRYLEGKDDLTQGLITMIAERKAVKNKYPKPGE